MTRFFFTENYNSALERIEDHIFSTTQSLDQVSRFLDEHDQVLLFIESNPNTPTMHSLTGDQTWLFGDGRYRIFFKTALRKDGIHIYLTHLIDNRQANIDFYPDNKIPTYDEES